MTMAKPNVDAFLNYKVTSYDRD